LYFCAVHGQLTLQGQCTTRTSNSSYAAGLGAQHGCEYFKGIKFQNSLSQTAVRI